MKNTNRKIIIILKIITKIKYFKTYIIPNFILQKWCYINPNNTMTLIHGIKINKMLYYINFNKNSNKKFNKK